MSRVLKRYFVSCFLTSLATCFGILILTNQSIAHNIFECIGIAFVFAYLLCYVLKSFYLDPVERIISMVVSISKFDFSQKLYLSRDDVLGDLAQNLNQMSIDIKRSYEDVVRERNEIQAVFTNMIDGVLVIGQDDKIIHISPSCRELLQIRTNLYDDRNYWEVVRYEQINDLIKEVFSNHTVIKEDVAIYVPQEKFLNLSISPISGEGGVVSSVVVVFHDITELKKYEKMRSEFVANVSHELKTPLTSIKGFAETLKDGAIDNPDKARHFLGIIENQAQRLENLVADLLSLSKLDSQEKEFHKTHEDILGILDSVVSILKNEIDEKKHLLTIDVKEAIPLVLIDRQAIEQVFINLLVNAIKFTPVKGTIAITVFLEKEWVAVEVKDSGIGIAREHIAHLFERFYRVDRARSREMGGTGLGLSIVKHIVQAHSGRIQVESEPEKGASFTVFFPITGN